MYVEKENDVKTAVRYYSRSGNTKVLAEALADAAGVKAVSVDAPDASINEPVDVLFVGGALYAYGLDRHLRTWLAELKKENVRKAVIFSTSWISKHSIDLIRRSLVEKGIDTAEEVLYAKNRPDAGKIREAGEFAKKFLQ